MTDRLMAVLEDPSFQRLFSPEGRAEVSVSGLVERGGIRYLLAGQVDRLLVTDDEVLVVDYKTNRPPPDDPASVPPAYVRQMAEYASALGKLYPDKKVIAALLWTENAQLMPLGADLLASALEA